MNWVIPLRTIWKRGDAEEWPSPRPGSVRFRFAPFLGIPLPNIFGEDERSEFNEPFSVAGMSGVIKRGEWHDGNIDIIIRVDAVDQGLITALPLALIIGAVAGIIGGVIVLALLSRIEAILDLPIAWLVGGAVILIALPAGIKAIKGKGVG